MTADKVGQMPIWIQAKDRAGNPSKPFGKELKVEAKKPETSKKKSGSPDDKK